MSGQQTKTCSRCGEVKLLSEFNKDARLKTGRRGHCQGCQKILFAHWRAVNQDACKERWQIYYQTRRNEINDRTRSYKKAWYQRNRERLDAKNRAYKLTNPEKAKEYDRAAHLRYYKKYNSEIKARERQWRKANPEKKRQLNAKRRALLLNNSVGEVDYQKILERDGYNCYICKGTVDPMDVHFDHTIPLSRNGRHSSDNIHVTHSTCNLRKGAKTLRSEN